MSANSSDTREFIFLFLKIDKYIILEMECSRNMKKQTYEIPKIIDRLID
jgi:hypothetical protein